jgi:hypothetical protein
LIGNIGLGKNSTIEQQYWYVRDLMGLEDSFTWQDLDYSTVQLADKLNPGNATADAFVIRISISAWPSSFNITACQMPMFPWMLVFITTTKPPVP